MVNQPIFRIADAAMGIVACRNGDSGVPRWGLRRQGREAVSGFEERIERGGSAGNPIPALGEGVA